MTAGKSCLRPLRILLHIALSVAILVSTSRAAAPSAPPGPPDKPDRLAVWPQGAGSPDFQLLDTQGTPRTLRDYHDRIVVIFFGFMHCPDACPAGLFKLAQVMKQLGPLAAQVQVLFITLDPERDTPSSLESYVSAFDSRFIGLTGSSAQIDTAASGFNVQYARVPLGNDYTIDHSTGIFIFDGAGHLRLVGSTNSAVADLVHDISALLSPSH